MFGGMAKDIFEAESIHGSWSSGVALERFAEKLPRHLQGQLKALHDGIPEYFIFGAPGSRPIQKRKGRLERPDAAREMIGIHSPGHA